MSERGPQIRSFTDAGRSAGPALRRPGVAGHALLFTRIAGHALLLSRLAEHARLLARVAGFALAFFTSAVAFAGPKGHKVPDLRPDPAKTSRARGSTIQVPLTIHIAAGGENPVATMRRIQHAIDRANEALRGYQMEVTIREIRVMPVGFGSITRRRDRRRIAHYAPVDGSVHVFMVDTLELRSPRRGDRSVRGLHWRYRGVLRSLRAREYVVVGADAPATTLVHEIGHLFGLPHDEGDQNLMCSCRRGPRQVFTATQGVVLRKGARAFLSQAR